jgi:hypothetical protein
LNSLPIQEKEATKKVEIIEKNKIETKEKKAPEEVKVKNEINHEDVSDVF